MQGAVGEPADRGPDALVAYSVDRGAPCARARAHAQQDRVSGRRTASGGGRLLLGLAGGLRLHGRDRTGAGLRAWNDRETEKVHLHHADILPPPTGVDPLGFARPRALVVARWHRRWTTIVLHRKSSERGRTEIVPATPWTCPFCNRPVLLSDSSTTYGRTHLDLDNADGHRYLLALFRVCPASDCRKTTLSLHLSEALKVVVSPSRFEWKSGKSLKSWTLIPPSNAKPFPAYVPKAIREDYEEACAIKDASAKAAAALSRRALQGMIRDFWKVKKKNLAQEIDALKGKVEREVWSAMEGVRKVGNIGAHMEKDVNLIIDVEPREADALIRLIEHLVKDWYIAREDRRKALAEVTAIATAKDAVKKGATVPIATPPAVTDDPEKGGTP